MAYKNFTLETFNVKNVKNKEKQELLALDVDSYNINVCYFQ